MKKTDKIRTKLQGSGITIAQLEDSKNKICKERIMYCLSNAIVIFLLVYGLAGFFLSAFDLPNNSLKLMLFTAVISVYLSFFYLNAICFNLGYILLLVYVINYTIKNFMIAGSGANAILNLIIVAIDEELNLTVLREFNEMYTDRYVSITSCMIIIIIFVACIMNIWVSRRMSLGNPIILAILVLEFSIYLNDDFSLFHLILILAGLTMFIIIKQNNEIPAEYKKKQKSFTYKKKTIRLKKRSNELKGNLISTAVFVCVVLLCSLIAFLSLSKTYLNSNSELKDKTDVVVREVAMFGLSALFETGNKTTGGMNNGTFGNVDSISFDYQTDLEVTFVPYTSSPIYIPTYYANIYDSVNRKWQNMATPYIGDFSYNYEYASTYNEYYQTYWMLNVMNNDQMFSDVSETFDTSKATFLIKNMGADDVFPAFLYYADNNTTGFESIPFGEAKYFSVSPLLTDYDNLSGFQAYYEHQIATSNKYNYSNDYETIDTIIVINNANMIDLALGYKLKILDNILILSADSNTHNTVFDVLYNNILPNSTDAEDVVTLIEDNTDFTAEIVTDVQENIDYYLNHIPYEVNITTDTENNTTVSLPNDEIRLKSESNHYTIFSCNIDASEKLTSKLSYGYNFDILTQDAHSQMIIDACKYLDFEIENSINSIETYLREQTGLNVFVVKGKLIDETGIDSMGDENSITTINPGTDLNGANVEKFSFSNLRTYVYRNYTEVPFEVEQRLSEICEEQGFNGTRFDVISQIMDFLAENYTYSYSPGATPEGEDFALYFLDEQKEGFCVHFATSACLLLRTMGIPAKYVEGYCLDSSNYEDAVLFSDIAIEEYSDYIIGENNKYVTDPSLWYIGDSEFNYTDPVTLEITDADAHAWVEVYFENFGWVPIEFTVGALSEEGSAGMTNLLGSLYASNAGNQASNPSTNNNVGTTIGNSLSKIFNKGITNFAGLFILLILALILGYKILITYRLYYANNYKRNIFQYRFICKMIKDDLSDKYKSKQEEIDALGMSYKGLKLLLQREYGFSLENIDETLSIFEAASYAPKEQKPDNNKRTKAFILLTRQLIPRLKGFKRHMYKLLVFNPFIKQKGE